MDISKLMSLEKKIRLPTDIKIKGKLLNISQKEQLMYVKEIITIFSL